MNLKKDDWIRYQAKRSEGENLIKESWYSPENHALQ